MSREVKRVALDFDWPLNTVWPGYCIGFDMPTCKPCKGEGITPEAKTVYDEVMRRPELMVARWEVQKAAVSAEFQKRFDDPDCHCKYCGGTGTFNKLPKKVKRALAPLWDKEFGCYDFGTVEPPKGPGWQMWETTSEGSPISPVFKTPEELARWLSDTGASTFGPETASYEQWMKMIMGPSWAPSMILSNNELKSGVAAV